MPEKNLTFDELVSRLNLISFKKAPPRRAGDLREQT